MVIAGVLILLSAPTNAIQCQETPGEILSCSYATQVLSNGQQAVVITVYVPPNFVFSSPTQIRVVVHTKTVTRWFSWLENQENKSIEEEPQNSDKELEDFLEGDYVSMKDGDKRVSPRKRPR